MKNYIYGAGGHGKVVLDAMLAGNLSCEAFIDDNDLLDWMGYSVIKINNLNVKSGTLIHIAIGCCKTRESLASSLDSFEFLTVKHPSATVSPMAEVDNGSFLAANSILAPDSTIGKHCIINHHALVDHDCLIGDYSHIAPHAVISGGVKIGKGVLIGAGAIILPGLKLDDYCIIGAGSVITKDVSSLITVVGNPARPI